MYKAIYFFKKHAITPRYSSVSDRHAFWMTQVLALKMHEDNDSFVIPTLTQYLFFPRKKNEELVLIKWITGWFKLVYLFWRATFVSWFLSYVLIFLFYF